jgi:cation diffusion facilitator family transporter
MYRNHLLKIASLISIAGNLALALLKIVAGLLAGSMAVLADGLDSLSDVVISFITLAASIIISRPPDREHPYGHFRAETIATSILSFVIFFIGGQMCILTTHKLIMGDPIEMPGTLAVWATLASIVGKSLLAWSQFFLGRKSGSRMLAANGHNMLNDTITSIGVLAGLGIAYYLDAPIVDRALALVIGVWIMVSAVRIFMGLVVELMEGHDERRPYREICEAVTEVSGAMNPHRMRIRRLGPMYVIDLDVEVDGSMSVTDAHGIAVKVEERIRARLDNVFDIVIHMEPMGNTESSEGYGLTAHDIRSD